MFGGVVGVVSTTNRFLMLFSLVVVVVLVGGWAVRRHARNGQSRGFRRRGGVLLAIGPLVGLAFAPSPDGVVVLVGVGAAAFAAIGAFIERRPHADQVSLAATIAGAGVLIATDARVGPTGSPALDVVLTFFFVVVIVQAFDGLGNVDGLVSGLGTVSAAAVFAIAGFAAQNDLAAVTLGLTAACFAFTAFNLPPASLFVGRGGRLCVGFTLAGSALLVDPVAGPGRSAVTPVLLLGVVLLDAAFVVIDRLRRRRALTTHRSDHMVHRLGALGWTPTEAMALLVTVQFFLSLVAVLTARALLPVWLGAGVGALVLLLLAAEVARGKLEHEAPRGFPRSVWLGLGGIGVLVAISVAVTGLAAQDSADLMLDGRDAASRGLSAARDGDTLSAGEAFKQAAAMFGRARDKLDSPALSGALAVPGVASNLRAARTLASIGTDLAEAGSSVTTAVDPDALEVAGGRLPVEEVVKITPVLERGSSALTSALRKLDDVRDDPYLAPPIEDAIDKVHAQLVQAEREARHAADAAKLAPALFGTDGARRYLLVVQNNAESRATGGFIGSFGTIIAEQGKLTVSELQRTVVWNDALRAKGSVTYSSPADYRARYGQFRPEITLQNVNMSPDFPSVAQVLMSLAPQADVGPVDGVISVDPAGLAALMKLTGGVTVPNWPTEITADNVVDVTLRDAYAVYPEDTGSRVDFLGDVAQEVVDVATSESLGSPAKIAQALGRASHEGHLLLAFMRPREQRLAEQLGAAGHMAPVRSDAIAVTSSNTAANKIDYYLQRSVDYRVALTPHGTDRASAAASLSVTLDNTAPASGLPQVVIGPFDARFNPGESRSLVSMYSPLTLRGVTADGKPSPSSPGRELDRNVVSFIDDLPANTERTTTFRVAGDVALHDGWYTLDVRHQPTLLPDKVHVSVDVPEGYRIDRAPGMERPFERRATATIALNQAKRYRVHVVKDIPTFDVWERLKAGR